ncbi:TadE family protein [Arthrobacter sp. I2-34]|uniref:TadE family protein n=1 Tax=Arthrobacter hankyongi TaxID=2904801 RepID=A0ABS9LA08_9MICC|nr:TadE family type IV pilus minor pilin [Arthrobacter hankyongi]MCG2623528.1 TadE family protein [Arthrobacter hankyongi]
MPARLGSIGRSDRGAATAEVAVVLPAVVALLGLLLAGATGAVTQLQLEKAAQAAVRQLGRGEPEGQAAATARRIAGEGAGLAAATSGGWVSVRVTAQVPGPWGPWSGWTLAAEATAPAEQPGTGAGPDPGTGSGHGG